MGSPVPTQGCRGTPRFAALRADVPMATLRAEGESLDVIFHNLMPLQSYQKVMPPGQQD